MSSKQMLKAVPNPDDPKYLYAMVDYDDDAIRPERRTFNIRTYSKLRKDREYWRVLEPINEFISTLDKDEYQYLVRLFVQAKRLLSQVDTTETILKAIADINLIVAKTFGRLDLSRRLHEYVISNKRIQLPDLSNVGTRPQDTPEMSFFPEHYDAVNTIILINKMLFPIFGEIIFKAQVAPDINHSVKEIYAFGILNALLLRDFEGIASKLQYYTSVIVDNSLSDNELLVFHGLTSNCLADDKLAKILVKNFINFDLYQIDSNIIKCISVSVRKSTKSDTSSNKRVTYMSRRNPDQGDDEDSNVSVMENEGHIFKETIDIPVIIQIAVERYISSYIESQNIRRDVFDEAYTFYMNNALPPTPINEFLAATFIDGAIGSAYGIKYLNADLYMKLIILVQMYMARSGYDSLIPLMSLVPTDNIKTMSDDIDNSINMNKEGTGHSYRNVKELILHIGDFFKWEEHFIEITEFIIDQYHHYNVPPAIEAITDVSKSKDDNGIFVYDKTIISEIYRLTYHLMIDTERKLT